MGSLTETEFTSNPLQKAIATNGGYHSNTVTLQKPLDTIEMVPLEDPPSYTSGDEYKTTNSTHPLKRCHGAMSSCCGSHSRLIGRIMLGVLFITFTVYLAFAVRYNVEWSKALIVLSAITVFFLVYNYIRDHYGDTVYKCVLSPVFTPLSNSCFCLK